MADSDSDIPTIDAIFVVRFDTRQGNVLEWSDSTPGTPFFHYRLVSLPRKIKVEGGEKSAVV
jgi:hypothetical protein